MKIRKMVLTVLLISMLLFLTGCNTQTNTQEKLSGKLDAQIQYLETEFTRMLNNINNISTQNYKVTTQKISSPDLKSESGENSGGAKKGEQTSKSQNSSSESEESQSDSSNIDIMQMEQNSILSRSEKVDWETIKFDIEHIQDNWNTIILDLYKININNEDVVKFGNDLDATTIAIKDENKILTLQQLSKLYEYLVKYTEQYSKDTKRINKIKTKYNVIKAYTLVDEEKWEQISKYLLEAEKSYTNILNNSEESNETNANKIYIALKELQNSISMKNKDVFYIKYRTFLRQLENF